MLRLELTPWMKAYTQGTRDLHEGRPWKTDFDTDAELTAYKQGREDQAKKAGK
jgi:hypothetical protein